MKCHFKIKRQWKNKISEKHLNFTNICQIVRDPEHLKWHSEGFTEFIIPDGSLEHDPVHSKSHESSSAPGENTQQNHISAAILLLSL